MTTTTTSSTMMVLCKNKNSGTKRLKIMRSHNQAYSILHTFNL